MGDLLIERNQQAPMSDEYPLMAFIANEGVAPKGERYDRSALVTDTVNKLYKKTEKGDFIYSSNNLETGSIGLNKYGKACISPVYSIFEPTGIADSDFLGRRLVRKDFINTMVKWRQGVIYGQWRIHESDFLKIEIAVPSVEEQRKIGTYLDQLDNLITLHQRKYDKLQILKKAMLEKMFPKNGSSVPEIRFKGFTDAWEQRKLGDNIVEYTEVTTENNQYPPLTSSRKGIFLQTEYFAGNQIASDDNTGYNIVPYGYFTYRHMSDDEVFHFNINDIVEKGIVSTLYPVFTTDENLDSRYLQYQLNYGHEFAKFAILQKQGGSRTYMYLNKLRQLHLTMPNHVEEQKAISSFFMNLDHLITLHQRELEKLQNIKKSMLEKMFV